MNKMNEPIKQAFNSIWSTRAGTYGYVVSPPKKKKLQNFIPTSLKFKKKKTSLKSKCL